LASRIHYINDPLKLPLPDNSVDLVVSNTVFEHIPTLENTVQELARILKPAGRIYTVFPLKSCIWEQHAKLPFVHKVKSMKAKERYIRLAKTIGLYRSPISPYDIAEYVTRRCHYLTDAEVNEIFRRHFHVVQRDTDRYVEIKADALIISGSALKRLGGKLLRRLSPFLSGFVHIRHSAAYMLGEPKR
jgi:SAM-dependent methyltransferase